MHLVKGLSLAPKGILNIESYLAVQYLYLGTVKLFQFVCKFSRSSSAKNFWVEYRDLLEMPMLCCRGLNGKFEQLTPGPESKLNARTRVHEYGGGESIIGNGVLYFSNFE